MFGNIRFRVANVWIKNGKVQINYTASFGASLFASLDEWRQHKLFQDMCDICNGSNEDHFPGCPNDWREALA